MFQSYRFRRLEDLIPAYSTIPQEMLWLKFLKWHVMMDCKDLYEDLTINHLLVTKAPPCISACDFGLPPELTDQDNSTHMTLTHDPSISGGVTHISMNITNICVGSEFQVKVSLTDEVHCRESNLFVSQTTSKL